MRKYSIYTDGACSGNPGPGGLAAVILDEEGASVRNISHGFRKTTNNRMEIRAVAAGLHALAQELNRIGCGPEGAEVTIYSDSQIVVNAMTGKGKAHSNLDCWEKVKQLAMLFSKVDCQKVKGHDKDKYNNLADRLAVEASKGKDLLVDKGYETSCEAEEFNAKSVFEHKSIPEPVITDIRFAGINTKNERRIEVTLSNGTVITIERKDNGFIQSGGTTREMQITVDVA